MHNGSKCVKSAKNVPIEGFVNKWSSPTPLALAPKFRKFCITKAIFLLKTHISWSKCPLGGLRDNVRCSSCTHWKARSGLSSSY